MSQIEKPDEDFDDSFDDDDARGSSDRPESRRPEAAPRPVREGGWLTAYKPEQGKNVRWGTFIGVGLLIVWGAKYIYDHLGAYDDTSWGFAIGVIIPSAFVVVLGALTWWATFVHPKAGDFMIATEGEMKKVSWSSRREVIGSTKVVIVVTLLLAVVIFAVDIVFQQFFRWIDVLKA